MKNLRGSNLVEYAIPIALIAVVVGLGLYYIYSSGYLKNFFVASGDMKLNKSTGKVTLGAPIEANYPGALGGKADKPVKECNKGKCTVDFGEFILTGIPDNFKEFVETQGNAGGTDELAIVFEQLAEQLLQDGDEEGYQQYMDMANLCHYQAKMERSIDTAYKECMKYSGQEVASSLNKLIDQIDTSVPQNLKNNPALFNFQTVSLESFFTDQGATRIDLARQKVESGSYNYDTPPYRDLNHAIVGMYDSIMDSPKYSDNLKSITTLLYKEIDQISMNQIVKASTDIHVAIEGQPSKDMTTTKYDPVTGEPVDTFSYYDSYWNPQAATETDLDSAIICVAGNNSDTGQECK